MMKGGFTKLKPVFKNVAAKVERSTVRFDRSLKVIKIVFTWFLTYARHCPKLIYARHCPKPFMYIIL